jgi:hypothetical protein
MTLDEGFPDCAPPVHCISNDLLHPHIEASGGNICFNLLEEDWDESVRIEDVIMGLLFLFYQPDFNDALTDHFYCAMVGCYLDEVVARDLIEEGIKDAGIKDAQDLAKGIASILIGNAISNTVL